MPTPLYNDVLTQESAKRLEGLLKDLPHPVALVGGHAVRLAVQHAWKGHFGEDYFGSRDIDVCYWVDPQWTVDEFQSSAIGQAPHRIKEIGYIPMGTFHFGLYLSNDGHVLQKDPPLPAILGIDFHLLRLDPMVTHIHPHSKEVLGFHPIDEPLFAHVFNDESLRRQVPELDDNVYLPTTPVLVASKLKSLPGRNKEDKAIKDLCDLYALVSYGGASMDSIRQGVHRMLDSAPRLVDGAMKNAALPRALTHLDLEPADFRAVVGPVALPP